MDVFDSKVTTAWGDGEYDFHLPLGELRELEAKRGAGFARILDRLVSKDWFVDDLRETIRLALIGGGKTPVEALALVKRYVDARPMNESVLLAQIILMAVLNGVPQDAVGKKDGAEKAMTGAMAASSSPRSTETARH